MRKELSALILTGTLFIGCAQKQSSEVKIADKETPAKTEVIEKIQSNRILEEDLKGLSREEAIKKDLERTRQERLAREEKTREPNKIKKSGLDLIEAGEADKGVVELRVALSKYREIGEVVEAAMVLSKIAQVQVSRGEKKEALETWTSALNLLGGEFNGLRGEIMQKMSVVYDALGEKEKAKEYKDLGATLRFYHPGGKFQINGRNMKL